MAASQDTLHGFDSYEQLMATARERFALSDGVRALRSSTDEAFLEAFLLHFCSLGAQMTRPVETWIGRAAARCAEIGLSELARALANHARAEAGHHLMMIADVALLTARWNARRRPSVSADDLLSQPPSPGVLAYRQVHEGYIASSTPYAQVAIEYEIEMLPLRFGELLIRKCIDVLGTEIVPCLSFLTEHVELDAGHTRLNITLMKGMLRREPRSLWALTSAGAAALDAYAAFLSDCVRLADEEVRKAYRPLAS